MSRNNGLAVLAILALAVGALWYFGRIQPVEVVEQKVRTAGAAVCPACQGRKQIACEACGGNGRVQAPEQMCAECEGTGRGKWRMGDTRTVRRMGGDPLCAACSGKGRTRASQACAACSGAALTTCLDCAGTGRSAAVRVFKTVRAGYSPWETVLSWLYMPPDDDAVPQVGPDGRVPMVDVYLALFQRNGVSGRVAKWGAVSRGANGWEVRTQLRIRRGDVESEEGRLFVVRNRQVISATPLAWP
ncbi:MAG: hypothetical protein BWK77_06460 [Verrucomicrobia bacterium A1]|nr:MAG: hypothetical protein BWK77_06460 [Verrucomicrobia bacterium A1]